MKTELRVAPHLSPSANKTMVELWYGGQLIGAIYGDDGPGVRVMSKHELVVSDLEQGTPNVTTVSVVIE